MIAARRVAPDRLWSTTAGRAATVGLSLVLFVLAAFAVQTSRVADRGSSETAAADELNEAFIDARYGVMSEESLERKYRLEPSPAVRAHFDEVSAKLAATLSKIVAKASPDAAVEAREALDLHATYLKAISRMFAAVDAGNTQMVLDIDGSQVDPVFGKIDQFIAAGAEKQSALERAGIAKLQRTSALYRRLTPLVFAFGFAMLALFLAVIRSQRRQLLTRSESDPLTGLPNRAVLQRYAESAIEYAEKHQTQAAVFVLDVDRFNEINDTLGHSGGDEVIAEIGRRVRVSAPPGSTVFHLGGAEFAVLAEGLQDLGCARAIAMELLAGTQAPLQVQGVEFVAELSVGVALAPAHCRTAAHLLRNADVAVHAAKASNTRFVVYDVERDRHSPERLALLGDLRRAIDENVLQLHYQPKLAIDNESFVGVEALLRWTHPLRGFIPPDEFIPLAERTSLIEPLTAWVLRTAARQARTWQERGLDVPIAVNVSAHSLSDPDFPAHVAAILAEAGVAGSTIEIEVTETAIMGDPARARGVLDALDALGIRLSVDDFGTGYSSLAYLRTLPVHALKIDRSFINNLTDGDDGETIVRSVIELAHNLGLDVVAEGVETAATAARLRLLGCEEAQGYYWSRPVPADQLAAWVAERSVHAAT